MRYTKNDIGKCFFWRQSPNDTDSPYYIITDVTEDKIYTDYLGHRSSLDGDPIRSAIYSHSELENWFKYKGFNWCDDPRRMEEPQYDIY